MYTHARSDESAECIDYSMSTYVFGCTGAVGSWILSTIIDTNSSTSVKTISRRPPKTQAPQLEAITEADTSKWSPLLSADTTPPTAVFNAVGTTKATAGSIKAQWLIDHDLCIDIAKAAKKANTRTFVFISSAGTRGWLTGRIPYSKMKQGVEDAIKDLEFEHAIILRPGMILGPRETPKAPFFEWLVGNFHRISQGFQDLIGQDQQVIARAAVVTARMTAEGKAPSKYWIVDAADVIKYGRT